MSLASKEDIEEFAEKVREKIDVEEIILFGSYARDNYVPDGDIDIAIIINEKSSEVEDKAWDIAGQFFFEKDLQFSPKIFTAEKFQKRIDKGYNFYENWDEGVRI